KVLDFGIARLFQRADHTAVTGTATQAGVAVGTLRYMSPEQACAEPVGSASDVFSLGLVLFELATGRHAFSVGETSDVALISAILTAPTPIASQVNTTVPAVFDALLSAMLDKDPRRRPAAAEVEAALLAMSRASPVAHEAAPAPGLGQHSVGRERERA